MNNVYVSCEKGIKVDKKIIRHIVNMICSDLDLTIDSLEFNFISSESMVDVNKKYLQHNYETDIITFDYSGEKNNLDGEIFISLHDAVVNSKKYKVSVDNELLRLLVHGILHLIGYDDITVAKRRRMKLKEDMLVKKCHKYSKGLAVLK
ncbi:rRNA maturation RNase YbeY [bacterium]|nr:rRNA maturation RNase YbeY [bacterium]